MHHQSGQTAIEYILLLLVVVVMITSVMGIVRDRLLEDQGNCTEDSVSIICMIENIYTQTDFRYFRIRR